MSADLTHVATYRQTVKAPLVRVWENVFDWEHLSWLHRATFCAIEHIDSGRWGWKDRFDVRTGRCIDSTRLRLHPAPRAEIDPASSEVRFLWDS